jgi:NhaP-type Na+/H+ or K+/H+ antiporter
MIFIPGLVFEGAYNTDGYTFNKSKWQVLMLAGPGVVLSSVFIACALIYLFGYGESLSMSEALLIA